MRHRQDKAPRPFPPAEFLFPLAAFLRREPQRAVVVRSPPATWAADLLSTAVLPGPQMQALNQELYEDMMNSVPRNLPPVRLLEPSLTQRFLQSTEAAELHT